MDAIIEIGKVSSRGQVAIPSSIRESFGLKEGSKVLFFAEDDIIMIKKVTPRTFTQITRPLKEAISRSSLKEKDAVEIVHKVRKSKNEGNP